MPSGRRSRMLALAPSPPAEARASVDFHTTGRQLDARMAPARAGRGGAAVRLRRATRSARAGIAASIFAAPPGLAGARGVLGRRRHRAPGRRHAALRPVARHAPAAGLDRGGRGCVCPRGPRRRHGRREQRASRAAPRRPPRGRPLRATWTRSRSSAGAPPPRRPSPRRAPSASRAPGRAAPARAAHPRRSRTPRPRPCPRRRPPLRVSPPAPVRRPRRCLAARAASPRRARVAARAGVSPPEPRSPRRQRLAAGFEAFRTPASGGLAPWPAWVGLALLLVGAVGGGVRVRARRARAGAAAPLPSAR